MAKKRYKVIRSGPVLGHPPGKTFEAELDLDYERYLLDIKALRVVPKRGKEKG